MTGDLTNLQVGYGSATGSNSLAVGREAAQQAVRGLKDSPPVVVLVFASVHYDLEEMLRGIQPRSATRRSWAPPRREKSAMGRNRRVK